MPTALPAIDVPAPREVSGDAQRPADVERGENLVDRSRKRDHLRHHPVERRVGRVLRAPTDRIVDLGHTDPAQLGGKVRRQHDVGRGHVYDRTRSPIVSGMARNSVRTSSEKSRPMSVRR